ncbi:MAG TPA: hypothetical protein VKB80_10630 [Kofleriaceae bacterium]|nr:hypothetical protein [Kofleriaceae bacterium]
MSARLLVANLDGEIELARAHTPGPHPDLSAAASRLVGPAASHMALLARPGDRLWLPAPAPPEAMCAAARERAIAVETGRLGDVAPARELCAWAETGAVSALRARAAADRDAPARDAAADRGAAADRDAAALATAADWRAALWLLRPPPDLAGRVNHRGFALALALDRGWALPGARAVRDVAELEQHLAGGGAGAGLDRAWLLKAPLSAAGRERHRGGALGRGERVRIERLLGRFGELVFEPWVDRVADLACAGLVHPGGVRLFAPHRLDNDPRGVFRAAVIDDAGAGGPAHQHRDAVCEAAAASGEALAAAGYRGPFSVDAYLWRDRLGALRLQRLSEINARLSFGLLARIAAEDAGAPSGPFELRP